MSRTVRLNLRPEATALVHQAAGLFRRRVEERSGAEVRPDGEFAVELSVEPGIGTEGYRIEDLPAGWVRVVGNDDRGVLYGVGKLLREGRYTAEGWEPGPWRGASVPQKPVRGMYFATHFHNFYHDAPLPEVERYVEELALWGFNALSVWFDMHHFQSFQDPEAQEMVRRLHAILSAARGVGLSPSLGILANEGYAGGPPELRATWGCGDRLLPAHYHVELCPSEPGAMAQLLAWTEERLTAFADCGLEYIWLWPYDQGGCCCHRCHPWGGNGYLKCGEQLARLAKRILPGVKIVLSTWDFNAYYPGEWEGLARAMAERSDWVDYIMADGREGGFVPYLEAHEPPGGLPVIGFPEISMLGRGTTWGGFGANPCPTLLQGLWDRSKTMLSGGFPYSEGIFEDLNKAMFAGFYWDPERPALDVLREYAVYEFGPEVADDVVTAIGLLDQTLARRREQGERGLRVILERPDLAAPAAALLQGADARMVPVARQAWRWRILLLRAMIEAELVRNDFYISEAAEAALKELTEIYHAQRAVSVLAPPTRQALAQARPI